MKFNSQVCTTREQSERLLSLGLKKETADMKYDCIGRMSETESIYREKPMLCNGIMSIQDIPAWSLHRLIEMLGCVIQTNGKYINLPDFGFYEGQSLYDNVINCIEWLIKEGYFNKAYLV